MKFDNNVPIYLQLIEELKKYIISGKFKPGERILSVRELAFNLKVNPNTMQRALTYLEEIGLIYTERTNGKFVTNDLKLIKKIKEEYATSLSDEYFKNMESIGFSKEEVIKYLERLGGK